MEYSKKQVTAPERAFSFHDSFEQLIGGLSARSQDIVRERFGVSDGHPKTLEEIGKKYRITRERVRQIIRSVIKDIRTRKDTDAFRLATQRIEAVLKDRSGIVKGAELLSVLGEDDTKEQAAILFFLECLPDIGLVKEDDQFEQSYALENFSSDAWKKTIREVKRLFETANRPLGKKALLSEFRATYPSQTSDENELFHHLAVSKEIRSNVFGKWGLASWSDIVPKGTREKAHLILKALKKPLHFREITDLIDTYGLGKIPAKKTHPQTVHNELIKDKRFVLVGRGTYALAEWGYARGTVRDVVAGILRAHGDPMKKDAIVEGVLALRKVKKSTVIINLNAFFAKVGKDAYTIKKK